MVDPCRLSHDSIVGTGLHTTYPEQNDSQMSHPLNDSQSVGRCEQT